MPVRSALLGKAHGTAFADDRHTDLARVGQILFDLFRDVLAQQIGGIVIHIVGIDHDTDLAARLDSVRLGHAFEAGGDAFQFFQTFDVVLQQFLAGAGRAPEMESAACTSTARAVEGR